MTERACFHCALPIDPKHEFQVEIDGELKPVCCPGCKAVAELIRDTGMSSYYAMREAPQPGAGKPAEDAAEWQVFDRDDMCEAFAEIGDGCAEATIYAGGMYCAACSWLIQSTLAAQPGIESADVNPCAGGGTTSASAAFSARWPASVMSRSRWRPSRRLVRRSPSSAQH
jgi:Cu2+-exporting ATPase